MFFYQLGNRIVLPSHTDFSLSVSFERFHLTSYVATVINPAVIYL